MSVQVEAVLRASSINKMVTLFYFHIASSYTGNEPLGTWEGTQYSSAPKFFYVNREDGLLRNSCDVVNYWVENVLTGSHPLYKQFNGKPFGEKLDYWFLTKGSDISDQQFANAIHYGARLVPEQYALPQLKRLAASSEPEVSSEACASLRDLYIPQKLRDVADLCDKRRWFSCFL